jgi:hypothetical protein
VWTISLADRSIASLIPNPSGVHVSAFVNSGTPAANANNVPAFRLGLKEAGFVEGQNVAIEFRWDSSTGGRDHREHAFGAPGQGRNRDGADRLHDRERPDSGRPCHAGWPI